jgi:hypothetical protein
MALSVLTLVWLDVAAVKSVAPNYCPILFHWSDSGLIAFVTSTTVAVPGLFLTAANWLYAKQGHKTMRLQQPALSRMKQTSFQQN